MSAPVVVAVRRLPHGDGLPLPQFATAGAAGADVAAAVESEIVLAPMERRAVPTGLVLAVPPGYEVQVRPRSGLGAAARPDGGERARHASTATTGASSW